MILVQKFPYITLRNIIEDVKVFVYFYTTFIPSHSYSTFKRFWGIMPLILTFSYFLTFIRTIRSYILSSFIVCRGPSSCISKRSLHWVRCRDSNSTENLSVSPFIRQLIGKNLHAKPRIELGPALQQADALPNELRCTLDVKVMYGL
jgi:hypothetical protein